MGCICPSMNSQTKLIFIGTVIMILLSTLVVVSVYSDEDGPLIYQIDVLPVAPVAGDYIGVTAYAIDPSGVSNVLLSYTIDGTNWNLMDMNFISCLCAAGGRWVVSFGPVDNSNIVRFFATAYDASPMLNHADSQIVSVEIGI